MKFTALILSFAIAISDAKTRRLDTIVSNESDGSMSYILSPANGGGGSSKASKAPTGAPTGSPTGSRKFEMRDGDCIYSCRCQVMNKTKSFLLISIST